VIVAYANPLPPARPALVVGRSMRLAAQTFPESPCKGQTVVLTGKTPPALPTPGVPPDAEAMGYAWSDRCTIWVNTRGLAPLSICYVTVHELGHLAGRAHEDGHGVMAPVVTDIDWAPCKRLMRGFRSTEGPWLFG
jgi:hypothetical protein